MSFAKLMEDLASAKVDQETLSKALSAEDSSDDKKIQAAADESGGKESDDEDAGKKDVAGKEMAKSFKLKLADGTEVDAEDGSALVKALQDELELTKGRIGSSEETMAKAMGGALELIKSQGEMIKSLDARVAKLANQGTGRKAMVSITDKKDSTTMAKSEKTGMTHQEFFMKAEKAQKAGAIYGHEIARAEAYVASGADLPEDLVQRVLSAQ